MVGRGGQVGPGHLLVQILGEHVHGYGALLQLGPQLDLGEHLDRGEGVAGLLGGDGAWSWDQGGRGGAIPGS